MFSINRSALAITLVWSFVAFSSFHFVVQETYTYKVGSISKFSMCVTAVCFLILGWLGDVYCGKHRVIRYSMCLLFVAATLNSLAYTIHSPVAVDIAGTLLMAGFYGFQSCIVQFSLDQLYDSSSDEIISYIVWYVWTYYASDFLVQFTQVCVCIADYKPLATLMLPVLLALVLCSDFFFSHLLVKEPVTHNPFKLIFQVLKYAVKNKYPRLRSAFTYWDDKRYSRIDLAKTKFGGPFTTEQVEDVKTFFRISTVILLVSLLVGIPLHAGNFYYRYRDTDCNSSMVISQLDYFKPCFEGRAVAYVGTILIVIFVPAYQLLLHPLFCTCIPSLSISKKVWFCILFIFLRVFSCLSLEVVKYLKEEKTSILNSSISCFRSSSGFNTYTEFAEGVSYYWLALPNLCATCSEFLLLIATIEFICAQAPYSMKDLLLGFTYFGYASALFISYLTTAFLKYRKLNKEVVLSCGVWFFLVCSVVTVLATVMLVCIGMCYKKRQRDDHPPSLQYFAERYYENNGID